jgi:peptidase E
MSRAGASDITLLGPQRHRPALAGVLQRFNNEQPLCAITAGWQDEEGQPEEIAALREHKHIIDLAIYRRSEDLFETDSELFQAHRERQSLLHELQRLYRLRLDHARQAVIELQTGASTTPQLLTEQLNAARAALRLLDRQHRRLIRRTHEQFAARWAPEWHALLAQQRNELAELIGASQAVLLAGGNIATLSARMRLFDLAPLLAGKPLIAWSAGAMLLTEHIVVFHDFPPQGAGHVEVLDSGLGLIRNWVVLPHARSRLRLDDRRRVANLAARFAPARCVTLNEGSELRLLDGDLQYARNVRRLGRGGRLALLTAA